MAYPNLVSFAKIYPRVLRVLEYQGYSATLKSESRGLWVSLFWSTLSCLYL